MQERVSVSNFCPEWVVSVAIASGAAGFLEGSTPLSAFSIKFANGLNEHYREISAELIDEASQKILEFLSEIEAGETAIDYLKSYIYRRVKFTATNKPRKFKGLFVDEFAPMKTQDYSAEKAVILFKAFVFSSRSGLKTTVPAGWVITDEDGINWFGQLVVATPTIFDAL